MKCPFCEFEKMRERVIIQNTLAFAFPTTIPIVPGHTLISPRRHVRYYEDMTEREKKAVEALRKKLKGALKKTFAAEGFNYAWNEEEVGGQSVPHFHLHVVPRKRVDQGVHRYEPRTFLYRPRARTVTTREQELVKVAARIRKVL